MAKLLSIQVDEKQMAELRERLNPKQFQQAMFQALTRTQRAGIVDIAKAATQIVNLKTGTVKDALFAPKPAKGADSAMIRISEKPQKLIAFKSARATKKGVSVRMRKDKPKQVIPFAFQAKVASAQQREQGVSHTGFFRRVKGKSTTGNLTKRGISPRLPIKELFGPSVLSLFLKDEITDLAEEQGRNLQEVLAKNVQSQLNRFLNRKKNT